MLGLAGLSIVYILFVALKNIHSGVGNKLDHVNKLIAEAKRKIEPEAHNTEKDAFELKKMPYAG